MGVGAWLWNLDERAVLQWLMGEVHKVRIDLEKWWQFTHPSPPPLAKSSPLPPPSTEFETKIITLCFELEQCRSKLHSGETSFVPALLFFIVLVFLVVGAYMIGVSDGVDNAKARANAKVHAADSISILEKNKAEALRIDLAYAMQLVGESNTAIISEKNKAEALSVELADVQQRINAYASQEADLKRSFDELAKLHNTTLTKNALMEKGLDIVTRMLIEDQTVDLARYVRWLRWEVEMVGVGVRVREVSVE